MHASLTGPNAIAPERMTPNERIAEVGRILGLALVRLSAAKSTSLSDDCGDGCLDFPPGQRRHADTQKSGKA